MQAHQRNCFVQHTPPVLAVECQDRIVALHSSLAFITLSVKIPQIEKGLQHMYYYTIDDWCMPALVLNATVSEDELLLELECALYSRCLNACAAGLSSFHFCPVHKNSTCQTQAVCQVTLHHLDMLGIDTSSIAKSLLGVFHSAQCTQSTAQVTVGICIGRVELKSGLQGHACALQIPLGIQGAAKQLEGPEVLGVHLQRIPARPAQTVVSDCLRLHAQCMPHCEGCESRSCITPADIATFSATL